MRRDLTLFVSNPSPFASPLTSTITPIRLRCEELEALMRQKRKEEEELEAAAQRARANALALEEEARRQALALEEARKRAEEEERLRLQVNGPFLYTCSYPHNPLTSRTLSLHSGPC